ncbi:MAG: hypothetical protein D6736_02625 [Nitrospinota bacterium]|nr:MAG: hypothetical protein D6736_02625 [Nitrospinota bacterium]
MSSRIDEEIIRRVLERDEALQEEQKRRLQAEATIEALQELTSLSREEIARIAEEVQASRREKRWLPLLLALLLFSVFLLVILARFTSRQETSPPEIIEEAPAREEVSSASPPIPLSDLPGRSPGPVAPQADVLDIDIYRQFTFVHRGFPLGLSVGQSTAGGLSPRPYEKLRREPRYRSSQVLYGYLPLGNGEDTRISFVVDELEQPAWTLYVDRNNNEDLTDDGPPLHNQGTGRLATEISLPVEVVTAEGTRILTPYQIWFWIDARRMLPYFYTRCYYRGQLLLAGTLYQAIAFEQFHHNALYRESGLWIDLNRDNRLDEEREHFFDGEAIRLEGEGEAYRLRLHYP